MDKPVVFLDYDGVVNTVYWREYDGEFKAKYAHSVDGFVNNFQAICWLNELYRKCPYDIVVTSTWRMNDNYKECLYNGGLDREIQVLGRTPVIYNSRCKEISQWMKENDFTGKFAILDDDSDMEELLPHLVRCNTFRGFGIEEMFKVLELIQS
jgi:hypothetical protein